VKDSKLILILKTLNKNEIEKFSLFLKSPLFNQRVTISLLFEEIRKFYPDYSDLYFTNEYVFKKLYKNRKYNDELMRNILSRLYKALENFLSFLNYENDSFTKQYGLLTELNNRGHEKIFKKKIKEINSQTLKKETTGIENYFQAHRLAFLERVHYDTFKHTHIIENDSLQLREDKLIEYFLLDILNIYSLMINQINLYPGKKYKLGILQNIKDYIDSNYDSLKDNFYIRIFYNMLMLLKEQDEQYFKNLKLLLNEFSSRLSQSEKSNFYASLHNYVQDKIFNGDIDAIRQKFELYKESFSNGGEYFSDGSISHAGLMNAVSYSMIMKDFTEADNFLKKYLDKVSGYYRESTGNYCRALIDYYKSNYEEVLKLLTKVNYDDVSFKVQVKTLTLMTYFSMNETESFFSFSDSFRHFLTENKKVSEYFKNLYINLINFSVKLFKGKGGLNKFDLTAFKKELLSTNSVAKKHWLLEQVSKIEKFV